MSRSNLRAGLRIGLWLLAAVAGGVVPALVPGTTEATTDPTHALAGTPAAQLPGRLAMSIARAREQVVSAIAVDFDHDGDLDVIATDASLDLLVWINDGGDHLTRRQPVRSAGWRPEMPPPGLDDVAGVPHVSTLNDPPSARSPINPWRGLLSPSATVASITASPRSTGTGFSLSPRAPPALS